MTRNLDQLIEAARAHCETKLSEESQLCKTWYRFVDNEHWEEGESEPERDIICVEWQVIAETERTVVIVRKKHLESYGDQIPEWVEKKRVLKGAVKGDKRFAYAVKDLAFASYKVRKQCQVGHARRSLERAEACLAAVSLVEGFLS